MSKILFQCVKNINELVYFFFGTKPSTSDVRFHLQHSSVRPTSAQMNNSHEWLMAAILDRAGLD